MSRPLCDVYGKPASRQALTPPASALALTNPSSRYLAAQLAALASRPQAQ
ncbi:MAG: hypothetical protein RBU37_03880 [Myxococcota bacterium]|nr:hypothetical protein [Myxococcota bacterium]